MAFSLSSASAFSSPSPSLRPYCTSPPLLPIRFPSSSHHHHRRLRRLRRLRHVVSSINTGGGSAFAEEERKREVLERYGLDLADYGTKSTKSSRQGKNKKDKEKWRKGREEPVVPQTPKGPRSTHRLLHVLGGKARRKKLLSPKGMDVRPMMELVRGAAFDILQVAGGCPTSLRPGRWLDLYSGTGSVGIEAISRGCLEAHFVEMDPWVVSEVLRPNLEWTGFLDVSVIHMTRVESFLQYAEQSFGGKSFDYISVTPPYILVDYNTLMEQLEKSPLVGKNTFILVEYPLRTSMSDSCGELVKIADRRFGRTHLAIYGPTWAQKKKRKEKVLPTLLMKATNNVESVI